MSNMRNYMADRYPVIDWLKARDLVMTNWQTGYCPVMLCRPDEIKRWSCIHDETETTSFGISKRFMTKKYYYASLIWNFALSSRMRERPAIESLKYQWNPVSSSFQQLSCDESMVSEFRTAMYHEMQRLADAHVFFCQRRQLFEQEC